VFCFQCDELRDIVTEEYWPWMAQYLVMKRASIEHNFHTLYSNFLDVLKIPELNQMVLRETFRNIKVRCSFVSLAVAFWGGAGLRPFGHQLACCRA
jgi:CCR4-NOT transcription complex subunit 1